MDDACLVGPYVVIPQPASRPYTGGGVNHIDLVLVVIAGREARPVGLAVRPPAQFEVPAENMSGEHGVRAGAALVSVEEVVGMQRVQPAAGGNGEKAVTRAAGSRHRRMGR